jgi:hypothetical protein
VKRPRYGKRKPKCSPGQPKLKTRMYARTNLKSRPMHGRRTFRESKIDQGGHPPHKLKRGGPPAPQPKKISMDDRAVLNANLFPQQGDTHGRLGQFSKGVPAENQLRGYSRETRYGP